MLGPPGAQRRTRGSGWSDAPVPPTATAGASCGRQTTPSRPLPPPPPYEPPLQGLLPHHQGPRRGSLGGAQAFFLRVLITVIGLTPSTRAVSRTPLPFSAMSIICRLTSGNRLVW